MSTVPAKPRTRKPGKPPFFRATLDKMEGVSRAALQILQGRQSFLYWLQKVPSDWGTAFRLEKFSFQQGGDAEEQVYHVLLSPEGNSCTCKGHVAHAHRGTVCKHVRAVLEVQGRL